MPEREELALELRAPLKGRVRATVHHPAGSGGGRRAAVALHRGISGADEASGDFLDAVATALAAAGLLAVRFEPRCSDLILADFNAYSVADETEDVLAVINAALQREDVDAARVSLLAFGLGAIAGAAAARRIESLARLSLVAPADGQHLASKLARGNGSASAMRPDQIPQAWLAAAGETDAPRDAAFHDRPALIVHGAADRFIPPRASLPFLAAFETAHRDVERLLVARADHAFTQPAVRQACIEPLVRFHASAAPQKPPPAIAGARL